MKTRIINIIQHPPAYEYINSSERPQINWDTPDGSWVGIWENDISDLVGKEILKISSNIEYEVWRPDLRADKIYSHIFESGVMHQSFPAKKKKNLFGLKKVAQIFSPSMLEYLKRTADRNSILHQNTVGDYLNQEILRQFCDLPKVINFHGKATCIPAKEMLRPRKNILANIVYFKHHRELLKNKKIYFTYQNSTNIEALPRYDNLGIERIFTGVDFNYFKKGNKKQTKKKMGINPNTIVFSIASRFVKLKQIDKIINILTEIDKNHRYDFILILAGRGEKDYEEYLKMVSPNLLKKKKLKFAGFLSGDNLLNLYQASDLFISASTTEGGPTSVIKAVACETPVFCTRVGGVDDILEQYHAGILVNRFDYKGWHNELVAFLDKRRSINLIDHNKAKEMFHWPNAARKYLRIYEILSKQNIAY
jgi:glycosyltransferase involved in cell wall biosynthesis